MPVTTYTNFGGRIVSENRNGVKSDYVADTLGNTAALVNASGVTDTWNYWPNGEVAARTGANPTPFTFVGTLGYRLDVLSNLEYVRARHLRPGLARWQTGDPLWPGESAYVYVGAGPIGHNDRLGRQGGPGIADPFTSYCASMNNYLHQRLQSAIDSFTNWWDQHGCLHATSVNEAADCFAELLARFDSSGLVKTFVRFKYGNCCGLKLRCSGNPAQGIDCLDSACSVHDACLGSVGDFFNVAKQCSCNAALCAKARNCPCSTAACASARSQIVMFYCNFVPKVLGC